MFLEGRPTSFCTDLNQGNKEVAFPPRHCLVLHLMTSRTIADDKKVVIRVSFTQLVEKNIHTSFPHAGEDQKITPSVLRALRHRGKDTHEPFVIEQWDVFQQNTNNTLDHSCAQNGLHPETKHVVAFAAYMQYFSVFDQLGKTC
ncbi:hypothetical protein AB835_14645 [Candidatus Endobugula sertula]|uniref:Uncharacterized protein n=1 Tax=Candidatus Endobugula sertula TaxID=62101 RepID=A0A1D2QLA8_9GAMM|nr:hypothetical protein AB835_14645 [Candidatus Endobugula sertula]